MTFIEATSSVGVGDVGQLYGALARRLEQLVRLDVRASDALIEDACQVAWCRLLDHSHRVHRETAMAWLEKTAVREAFKLLRRDRREPSLEAAVEAAVEAGEQPAFALSAATPEQLLEHRERLREMHQLPERQQRLVWLGAFGLNYVEMGAHEGCTRRTVERQLLRARAALRDPARELELG
jgi:RNA polymerase sigma factor (sigma-70 family)